MKNLLVGNGINIQFDKISYSTKEIVLRLLKNCDRDDFPSHIIVNEPYLIKNYIGQLFLEARMALRGYYDEFTNCRAEVSSLAAFKEQYSKCLSTLKITDIAFEDYYLIHDLVCHKLDIKNPEQYHCREGMRTAYLWAIYNDGKLDNLYLQYSKKFVDYLKRFDSIFTTNYDSNIDYAVGREIYHIHGWFKKRAAVYDYESFRNQLPDAPIKDVSIDDNYYYLYSNALTTHCGAYKEFQLKQYSYANEAITKLADGYTSDAIVRNDVDSWIKDDNKVVANMGYAVKLKVANPFLEFRDDFHFDKFANIGGEIEILGLSPWNDFHIFEAIDKANLTKCTYYYFSQEQCDKISELLPTLDSKKLINFVPVVDFWRDMDEA